MGNLVLRRKTNLSPFRKVAIGTWQAPEDPSVYGALTLRMEPALAYMDAFRVATGRRVTITHLMGRAAGAVFERMPDANAILRGKRLYLRDEVALFFQVVLEDPETGEIDLSGMLVREPARKTLLELVDEMNERTAKVKAHRDRELAGARSRMARLPTWLVGPMLRMTAFLGYDLNLDLRRCGIPRDPFGSMMITNIGSIGLEEAYAPLVGYSRVPIVIALGAIEDTPVVEGGRVIVGKTMRVCATFDHRILDGAHAALMASTLKAWFARPAEHFGAIPVAPPPARTSAAT